MPDKRMIDANALLEKLGERYLATDPSDPEQLGYLYSRVIVRNQPTIDAVDVVRCRECKESEKCHLIGADNLYCNVWDTVVHCDGFCHKGAKMAGGEEG